MARHEVQRSTYFITLLFFPIFLMRIGQNLVKKSLEAKTSHVILPKWMNSLLIRLLDLERLYLRWANLPFGVTVLATVRKPEVAPPHARRQELFGNPDECWQLAGP